MGRPAKPILVTEDLTELKRLHKQSACYLQPRIQMLILSRQGKYALADAPGVNHNSVQNRRKKCGG